MASSPIQPALKLTVHRAKNLRPGDGSGLADSYVQAFASIGDHTTPAKCSPVQQQTLFPHWDYKFEWLASELPVCCDSPAFIFHIQVWHHNIISVNVPLGEVRLRIEGWHPSEVIQQWFPLKPSVLHDDVISGALLISYRFTGLDRSCVHTIPTSMPIQKPHHSKKWICKICQQENPQDQASCSHPNFHELI